MKPASLRASRVAAALAAVAATVLPALAQEGGSPQEIREELMEEIGDATGTLGRMVKGETEYDLDAALEALSTIETNATEFPTHFPEGSEGGDALPAIWENKQDFEERAMALAEDASAIIAEAPADIEAFRPMFQELAANCRACHEDYRAAD